ncbi:hypothetical protein [Alloalcanivorax xenomutans]|uniref:hypothetical protein n=1 Tax=Alloalcanivorax xenomutans TaxID=1094342 RepID=UPI0024E24561|nr:hypothetical protein [Alloalcanivorax xenomutans]
MSTKILKTSMLALAGAVAFAAAGSASAMPPPYAMCTFKGETELTVPGQPTTSCWLTLTTKVNCAGDIEVVAAGPVAGQANCPGLFLGNFPWTGSTPALGTIDTGAGGSVAANTGGGMLTMIAGGIVYNVSDSGGFSNQVCDGVGNTVQVPNAVEVTGLNNFGFAPNGSSSNATFNTVGPDHLVNRGCVF